MSAHHLCGACGPQRGGLRVEQYYVPSHSHLELLVGFLL